MGLFSDDFETPSFVANAFLAHDDFAEFGRRLGLPPRQVQKHLPDIVSHEATTLLLLDRSPLLPEIRARYTDTLASRRQCLRYSLTRAA